MLIAPYAMYMQLCYFVCDSPIAFLSFVHAFVTLLACRVFIAL